MVKKMKIFLIIVTLILIAGLIVAGIWFFGNGEPMETPSPTLPNDEGGIILTEEQMELLKTSILPATFEQMSDTRRYNALLFLEAMREIDFQETRPHESRVSLATWRLGLLGIEKIAEFTIVEIDEGHDDVDLAFIAKITCEDGGIYHLIYHRSWGLQMVIEGDYDEGEVIYSGMTHMIIDDEDGNPKIIEREPWGSIITGNE